MRVIAGLRVRGWTWLLSMLWVVIGAGGAIYATVTFTHVGYGQGVIWMVADDPTSASDELVIVDIETPMTSSSPGTIRSLAAAVNPSSATVLGVAAAVDW